jgi:uncharacterized membrane protein
MSRNITLLLMYHHHKLLDLIYIAWVLRNFVTSATVYICPIMGPYSDTEQTVVAVILKHCIREVLGTSLGLDTGSPD